MGLKLNVVTWSTKILKAGPILATVKSMYKSRQSFIFGMCNYAKPKKFFRMQNVCSTIVCFLWICFHHLPSQVNLYSYSCTPKSPKVSPKKQAVKTVRKEKFLVFNENKKLVTSVYILNLEFHQKCFLIMLHCSKNFRELRWALTNSRSQTYTQRSSQRGIPWK